MLHLRGSEAIKRSERQNIFFVGAIWDGSMWQMYSGGRGCTPEGTRKGEENRGPKPDLTQYQCGL